jgi:prepilin-type processing-associated H-X9-DG protein
MRIAVTIIVVVVGTAIAGGIIVMLIGRARSDADRARCMDNLRRICQLHVLEEAQRVKAFSAGTIKVADLPPDQRLSWIVPGLSRLGHDELAKSVDIAKGWEWESNTAVGRTVIPHLICPAIAGVRPADGMAPFDYPGMAGVGVDAPFKAVDAPGAGVFRYDDPTPVSAVKDGLANTLLLMETARHPGPWIAGGTATVRGLDSGERPYIGFGKQFGGAHPEGANASMADGSGRFIGQNISPRVLELLAGIADGDLADISQ